MDMVERVARALFLADTPYDISDFHNDDELRKVYVDLARAAISAMREPTGAALEPIQRMPAEMVHGPAIAGIKLARETWGRAIDAALEE